MAFIRAIHGIHYSTRKSRFSKLAFKDYEGISIIDFDCAVGASGSICRHLSEFYSNYHSPTIFWTIPEGRIPEQYPIRQQTSEQGDECHHNIHDMPPNEAEAIAHAIPLAEVSICDDGVVRPLVLADLPPSKSFPS